MGSPVSSRTSSPTAAKSKRPISTKSIRARLFQSKTGNACGDQFSPSSSKHVQGEVKRIGMDEIFKLIESTQWKERKIALDELAAAIAESRKLDLGKILKYLRTLIMTDTNVLLAAKAVQCITALAQTENFDAHAALLLTVLLEKFKEKKPVIVDAVREATDAIYLNTSFGQIFRYVKINLASQNSGVKAETELFLQRCFTRPFQCLMSKVFWEPLAVLLVMNLSCTDSVVRENAIKALGTMRKVVGKADMEQFLENVPYAQKIRIDNICEQAVIEWNSSAVTEPCATVDNAASEQDGAGCKNSDADPASRKTRANQSSSPRSFSAMRRAGTISSTGSEKPRIPHHAYVSMSSRMRRERSQSTNSYDPTDGNTGAKNSIKERNEPEFQINKERNRATNKIDNLIEAMEEKINFYSSEIRELAPALLREVRTDDLKAESIKWNNRLKAMENVLRRNHF